MLVSTLIHHLKGKTERACPETRHTWYVSPRLASAWLGLGSCLAADWVHGAGRINSFRLLPAVPFFMLLVSIFSISVTAATSWPVPRARHTSLDTQSHIKVVWQAAGGVKRGKRGYMASERVEVSVS